MTGSGSGSLVRKFRAVFTAFSIITLIVCGVATYLFQMHTYKMECEKNVRAVGEYLCSLMQEKGEDVAGYIDYYMEHYRETDIPYDFDNYLDAYYEFESLFVDEYSGKDFEEAVEIAGATDEIEEAYFLYNHEYWLLTFEKARKDFGLAYTYFLVMGDKRGRIEEFIGKEDETVVYLIDGERTLREEKGKNGEDCLYLGDTYYNPKGSYEIMWKTWETGEKQNGYQEWNNKWGHTYGYYTPLIIDGEKLGLVVTEIDFRNVNEPILKNTIKQMLIIIVVFIIGELMFMFAIRRDFLVRINELSKAVRTYSSTKNRDVSEVLNREFTGNDEISMLGKEFGRLIDEIDEHITNLKSANKRLEITKQHATAMAEIANKDVLTGVGNKNSYDKEVGRIKQELEAEECNFGLVIVNLNGLNAINRTQGHEKGNEAIKKLAAIVDESFKHSPVFRIGADDFIVMLKYDEVEKMSEYLKTFRKSMEAAGSDGSSSEQDRISAALGYAVYDASIDNGYYSVFDRAFSMMREQKEEMKKS